MHTYRIARFGDEGENIAYEVLFKLTEVRDDRQFLPIGKFADEETARALVNYLNGGSGARWNFK